MIQELRKTYTVLLSLVTMAMVFGGYVGYKILRKTEAKVAEAYRELIE